MDFFAMIIGTYIITILVSYIMEYKRKFEIFKDIADVGYKINIDRTLEIGKSLNINNNLVNTKNIELLIPIYNLAKVLDRYSDYYNSRNTIFHSLLTMGLIEEMTDEEKREYNKKRTVFNALLIQAKSAEKIDKALNVILKDGSKIWFEIDKDSQNNLLNGIKVLKAEGRASYLNEQEQKVCVFKVLGKLYTIIELKYDSVGNVKGIFYQNNDKLKNGINENELDRILEELSAEEEAKKTNSIIEEAIKFVSNKEEIDDELQERNKPKTKIKKP